MATTLQSFQYEEAKLTLFGEERLLVEASQVQKWKVAKVAVAHVQLRVVQAGFDTERTLAADRVPLEGSSSFTLTLEEPQLSCCILHTLPLLHKHAHTHTQSQDLWSYDRGSKITLNFKRWGFIRSSSRFCWNQRFLGDPVCSLVFWFLSLKYFLLKSAPKTNFALRQWDAL